MVKLESYFEDIAHFVCEAFGYFWAIFAMWRAHLSGSPSSFHTALSVELFFSA